ncbi:MAG: hypothetical protein ACEQSF_02885 [Solirubrobacteraceae bacterium]
MFSLLLLSCSASKKATQLINKGNHDAAIEILVKKIAGGVSNKAKTEYNVLLFNAYNKLVTQSKERLIYLYKDTSSQKFEEIYNIYSSLTQKQQAIKPLLPLKVNGRGLNFNFEDYTNDLITSKNNLVTFLYENAKKNIKENNKVVLRRTFDDLIYLDKLQPGYRNVNALINEAQFKGTDFVYVSLENKTQTAIPKRLENELLQFSTYGLNDKWTVYHSTKRNNTTYDYRLNFNFQHLMVSPERIEKNKLIQEKIIVEGTEYLVNETGEQVRDNLGNLIKIDKKITIRCEIEELIQMKDATIGAKIEFWDQLTNQLIQDFPLQSTFSFRDVSARVRGDERALDETYIPNIKNPIPFPSNEQLIYEGGQDLKNQLKNILASYKR